ncbi:MAG: DUF3048 domain-containing protein [Candidatus Doudnabacteria bacterium]
MKIKILIIFIIVFALGVTIWRAWLLIDQKIETKQKTEEQALQLEPSINGNLVYKELAQARPHAVVIENHTESRPQAGLTDAEIVYETLAEGGITRFLALFQTRQPHRLGPVRSARPYFNFLANVWQSSIVHSGGSEQALSELRSKVHKNLYDINEFYFGDYFKRDLTRFAPHNLYTTVEELNQILKNKEQTDWAPTKLWETETTPTDQQKQEVTQITIPFSTSYQTRYQYDPTTNSYLRFNKNEPHIDQNNNQQISPHNVLIMLAAVATTGDELGTLSINLSSEGPCYLFKSGTFTECRWSFDNNRHYYKDLEGNNLKLEPGQTWIEIFPRDQQNQIKW